MSRALRYRAGLPRLHASPFNSLTEKDWGRVRVRSKMTTILYSINKNWSIVSDLDLVINKNKSIIFDDKNLELWKKNYFVFFKKMI